MKVRSPFALFNQSLCHVTYLIKISKHVVLNNYLFLTNMADLEVEIVVGTYDHMIRGLSYDLLNENEVCKKQLFYILEFVNNKCMLCL